MTQQKKRRHLMSLRSQLALVALVVWTLLTIYSNSILWAHVDEFLPENYQLPAKIGLLFFDVITLALIIWKIYQPDKLLANWCLIGEGILVTVAIVHVAGVATLANTRGKEAANLRLAAEIQAESAKRQIEGITAGAQNMGKINEYQAKRFADRAMKNLADSQKANTQQLTAKASEVKGHTFLGDWWMSGPMYAFMPGIAMLIFLITLFIASGAVEDEDGDGVPDFLQGKQQTQATPSPAGPIPATAQSHAIPGFSRGQQQGPTNYNINAQGPAPQSPKV